MATISIVDPVITLHGRNNIIGRSLVIHAYADDLGKGGNAESLISGNSGPGVACGVIGLVAEIP